MAAVASVGPGGGVSGGGGPQVSAEWLHAELRAGNKDILILDCRNFSDFIESHIKQALNFFLPSIPLRRLNQKKIDIFSAIKCRHLKAKIAAGHKANTFVLYSGTGLDAPNEVNSYNVLKKILKDDGCSVVTLEGGFARFFELYPEWCESEATLDTEETEQLMGLRSLRISTPFTDSAGTSSTESSESESSAGGVAGTYDNPVEILPWLYLGNATHSEDSEALQKYGIRYILNVTPNLPNVFERSGDVKYLQIPITDHWSQDLSQHFPAAIKFIEEARAQNSAVLVHCLAGVSRSVTITLAYLMYTRCLCLNDAFSMVRARKPDISPNFHFMEQLHTFERQLRAEAGRTHNTPLSAEMQPPVAVIGAAKSRKRNKYGCSCLDFECKCATATSEALFGPWTGVSPDSGIEFDRWTPSDNTPK